MGGLLSIMLNKDFIKLLYVTIACLAIGKIHMLFDNGWVFYGAGQVIQQFIICIALYSFVPYSNLAAKSMAFLICLFPMLELILLFKTPYGWWFIVISLISICLMLHVMNRKYKAKSDTFTDDYVYIIARSPNSFITFIAALFGKPYGRYSYYLRGNVYHYHHDTFKIHKLCDAHILNATIIKSKIKYSHEVEKKLCSMIGNGWSYSNNCMNVLNNVR